MKIWITRAGGGSLVSRGMGQIFVWFHEPCLNVDIWNDDPFREDNSEQDQIRKDLFGILYEKNLQYNFIYRAENNKKSAFGNKLIRNDDGIDFPEKLVELYDNHKLTFSHEVFGSGPKGSYTKNTLSNMFGYDHPVSQKAWELVVEEFQQGKELTREEFLNWSNREKELPWYRFCRELEIEITLKE